MRNEGEGSGIIPEWDVADRMRKAMRVAGLPTGVMADRLGVSRESVGRWINGRVNPSLDTLNRWSEVTGVSYAWIRFGDDAHNNDS
ncbi:XRE family transcriptional regulator [Rhodococcus rhodnii]|uniref:HTH cro/C1-type domain-containing protein n=2 Tax=Rhodococcus rhodnii TaxID=38312 RepID=R7WH79_9NOCA|nr:helix-turn-helix transcriptional regulator [Rhodococcus rhodnii]EOM74367.1 hypothetical protein Rrhod_4168 [Rhodococcus rhodnii LMG 5362]TXG88272.1 XRE family transcriptional regulator [Rhodococcus rhodnii]TXG89090.1 XRE family transcriptional regulator [Rhodococcus rhodnii]